MAKKAKKPKAPANPLGFSRAAADLWRRLRAEYLILDSGGLTILEAALRSFDRAEEARRMLDKDGCCIKDRWGQVKPHPAAPIERDARGAFLTALRQLHIELPDGVERGGADDAA